VKIFRQWAEGEESVKNYPFFSSLLERIKLKKANVNGTYDFYFRFEDNGKLCEIREKKSVREGNRHAFDYSEYLNAWHLIAKYLGVPSKDR